MTVAGQKIIVITGANAGIGKAAAQLLAEQGHHVVMVCRSVDKGQAAANDIRKTTDKGVLAVVPGDLSTIAGTRAIAKRLLDLYPEIHVLINNAGVWMSRRTINADGFEMTFMVNHLAPYLLTSLLLDRLKASAPARVIMVNAGLYANGEADLNALPAGENFHRFKTYMHSKLLNVYIANEFAKRVDGTRVTVNAIHPGVIRTNLGDAKGPLGFLLKGIKLLWKKPADGAASVVNLATNPALETKNGAYYNEFQEIPLAPKAQDPNLQQAIWQQAQKLTAPSKT